MSEEIFAEEIFANGWVKNSQFHGRDFRELANFIDFARNWIIALSMRLLFKGGFYSRKYGTSSLKK